MSEAHPEAAAILEAAGWKPHDVWQVYTRGTLVMGLQPDGRAFHVKNWGMDIHGPDTPDDPVEAAQWLVARFSKSGQDGRHETDSETLPEVAADADRVADDPPVAGGGAGNAIAGAGWSADPRPGPEEGGDAVAESAGLASDAAGSTPEPDPTDADFIDLEPIEQVLAEEPLALPEPEPVDFDPDEIAPVDEVAEAVAIFGDNLPMQRLLLIGAVTRHAAQLKAILQDGWTLDEFRSLQNLVVRIDRGEAADDPLARARFQAISEASRAMSAIDSYAEAQVAFLEGATREQIEAYRVEEGWP